MVFLVIAVVVLIVGLVMVFTGQKGLRRYHRIKNTPTSRIADAPGNGLIEVKGQVLPGENGTVQAPFSGRHGVWVAVDVQEYRRQGKSGSWVSIHNERHVNPFYIDDGSGQRARIEPAGADLVVDLLEVATSGTFRDAQPHLQHFLQSRNLTSTNFIGMNKSMRFLEYVLEPAAPIYALGGSRRDPGPPVHDGYRMTPTSQLVLFHGGTEQHELIVSPKDEESLAAGLRRPFLIGVAIAVGGALVLTAQVIYFVASLV